MQVVDCAITFYALDNCYKYFYLSHYLLKSLNFQVPNLALWNKIRLPMKNYFNIASYSIFFI